MQKKFFFQVAETNLYLTGETETVNGVTIPETTADLDDAYFAVSETEAEGKITEISEVQDIVLAQHYVIHTAYVQ